MDVIKLKRVSKVVTWVLMVTGLTIALSQMKISRYFPIKNVRVYGAYRVNHEAIRTTLLPLVKRGFFNVNVESIRDRLLQLPWVSDIFVRREWPDQIEIRVVERAAIATWNKSDLLSDTGEVFQPTEATYPAGLPDFEGVDGEQVAMLQNFNAINRILAPVQLKIKLLELTPYLTWKLTLDNGIKIQLGDKDSLTRLEHFVKVYSKIVGDRAGEVDYIDLRYSNGVAVRWKKAAVAGLT